MSYKVLDVCRHVINYSNEHDYGISNLKLQKVLYFIQAYFLTKKKDHTPCFDEKIEAWDFGPVVPEAMSCRSMKPRECPVSSLKQDM